MHPNGGMAECVISARGAVNRLFIRQMFFRFVFSTREAARKLVFAPAEGAPHPIGETAESAISARGAGDRFVSKRMLLHSLPTSRASAESTCTRMGGR